MGHVKKIETCGGNHAKIIVHFQGNVPMLQDQRSIMLANEGYFVVEVGYNCQKYGQKSVWLMPEYPVEYFEAVIKKAIKHPRKINRYFNRDPWTRNDQ